MPFLHNKIVIKRPAITGGIAIPVFINVRMNFFAGKFFNDITNAKKMPMILLIKDDKIDILRERKIMS